MRKDTRLFPLFRTASGESWMGPKNEARVTLFLTITLVYAFEKTGLCARLRLVKCCSGTSKNQYGTSK